jgi:hypothetical protein
MVQPFSFCGGNSVDYSVTFAASRMVTCKGIGAAVPLKLDRVLNARSQPRHKQFLSWHGSRFAGKSRMREYLQAFIGTSELVPFPSLSMPILFSAAFSRADRKAR